jgi:hypothetical protein
MLARLAFDLVVIALGIPSLIELMWVQEPPRTPNGLKDTTVIQHLETS